jgi:NAD-dependent dihydropyrimidine dehydrogenase PreA subunit
MKRTIIKIDEDKCNGCGNCVTGCHEGALQLIDGKARMISELFCDGLGACIGDCPQGAIELEEREAEPYDELQVIERISKLGNNTINAHLKHLGDHQQTDYVKIAVQYLTKNNIAFEKPFESSPCNSEKHDGFHSCPGSMAMDFREDSKAEEESVSLNQKSELKQWPIQFHLVNPLAPYFQKADILLAADCTAFAMGNFHNDFLKGKSLVIACPKLDSNKEIYIAKLTEMIENAKINSLTVLIMEVPCCGGLLQLAKTAMNKATRKIPLKLIVVGLQGDIISEEWV